MSRYFDEQETISREKRKRDQENALRLMAGRGYRKSSFFRLERISQDKLKEGDPLILDRREWH
jgi:hypothetical protein